MTRAETDNRCAVVQRCNLLFDFYGELLTAKQRDCFILRYMDDHSLSEISARCHITPQAVADSLKRTVSILESYETKLGLAQKFSQQQAFVKRMRESAERLAQIPVPEAAAIGSEILRLAETFPL